MSCEYNQTNLQARITFRLQVNLYKKGFIFVVLYAEMAYRQDMTQVILYAAQAMLPPVKAVKIGRVKAVNDVGWQGFGAETQLQRAMSAR